MILYLPATGNVAHERVVRVLKVDQLSKMELVEIYAKLNNWEWDYRLGVKPKDYDEMPSRDRTSKFEKYSIIKPIMKEIELRTSERQRFKHLHLNLLGKTRLQFETWWLKRVFRARILRQSI